MRYVLVGRGDPWLYTVGRLVLVPAVRLYGRFDCVGATRLPESGPAIVVANHHSVFDPILLGISFARPLHFMADVVQFRRGFVGPVITRLGAFPVNKGRPDRTAMESGLALLRAGEVMALFPEGDLYVDGRLREFGRGLGFFALRSGAPVIPVGITGADSVWRDGRFRRPEVRMVVGPPVDLTGLDGVGAQAYAQAAERVRAAVASLRDGRPDPPF